MYADYSLNRFFVSEYSRTYSKTGGWYADQKSQSLLRQRILPDNWDEQQALLSDVEVSIASSSANTPGRVQSLNKGLGVVASQSLLRQRILPDKKFNSPKG